MIREDDALPDTYEGDERKVVWIETKKMNKVFPGSRKAEKRQTKEALRSTVGYQHLPKEGEVSFLEISLFLEGILMEHKDKKSSLDFKLQIGCICSIRIRSRNRDIIEKPLQLI